MWAVILTNVYCFWELKSHHSVAQLCLHDCSTPGFPVLHYLLEFAQTHVHWVGDSIQPSHPLSSPLLQPSIFPTIRVFFPMSQLFTSAAQSRGTLLYWCFSFKISPSNTHTGLISSGKDWLDLLAVQGTLKSLLQYHSSKASILRCSAFFTVQLSHPYMTTGKTIALTSRTLVGKVMSLHFLHFSLFPLALWIQSVLNLFLSSLIGSDIIHQHFKCSFHLPGAVNLAKGKI